MVAPHHIGKPQRSYVWIPDSGYIKSAKPGLWDLARASTLAATIYVPPTLNVLARTSTETSLPNNQQKTRPTTKENGICSGSSTAPKIIGIKAPPNTAPDKTSPVTLMADKRIPSAEIKKIRNDIDHLKKKEKALRKRLSSLLRQLARNPQRLKSVLHRLEKVHKTTLKTRKHIE